MRKGAVSFEKTSCLHFVHAHLTALGHELPEIPAFDSAAGAKRAMKARGWASVEAMLDEYLEPIPPARMVLGDVATAPGEGGLATIVIASGTGKLLGWHPETRRFALYDGGLDNLTGAWKA